VIEIAVAMTVSTYNVGKTTLTTVFKELGILPGYYTECGYWKQDLLHIYQNEQKSSDEWDSSQKKEQ